MARIKMLDEIIHKAYTLFAGYRAERPLDVCTGCCMSPEEEARLASLPVREIPHDLLATYNDSAHTAKIPINEVKHFLPRFLDLVAQFKFPSHSAELSFSKLGPFSSEEWKKEESELLEQFALEFFKHCLSIYPIPEFERIDSILIMLWIAGFDIEVFLNTWEKDQSPQSLLHFRDLHMHGFDYYNPTKLRSGFGEPALAQKLRSWLGSENVKKNFTESIEQAILMSNDGINSDDQYELDLLYSILRAKV